MMEMPFGKHRGKDVQDLPVTYLEWLKDNVELYGDLQEAVDDAIQAKHMDEQFGRGKAKA